MALYSFLRQGNEEGGIDLSSLGSGDRRIAESFPRVCLDWTLGSIFLQTG